MGASANPKRTEVRFPRPLRRRRRILCGRGGPRRAGSTNYDKLENASSEHAQLPHDEEPLIDELLEPKIHDRLRIECASIDAQQDRMVRRVGGGRRLKRRGHLARVHGMDIGVRVFGHQQHTRIR